MPSFSEDGLQEIRNDENLCFSDSERSSNGDKVQSDDVKDYWFGKKYFDCVLAESILNENTTGEAMTVINSMFDIASRDFNYSDGVSTLRTLGWKSIQSRHTTYERTIHVDFLSLVGLIARHGSEGEQRDIRKLIYEKGSAKDLPKRSLHKAPFDGQHHDEPQTTTRNGDATNKALYTMTLKEHGDSLRVLPSYEQESDKQAPPTFKVTVTFQNITATGSGRTKKEAKHEASRNMCSMLGLKVL